MQYRKILLPLSATEGCRSALTLAHMVARTWKAHIDALHVRLDPRDVAPLAGEGLSGAMIEEMMTLTEKEGGERAKAARAMFDEFCKANAVTIAETAEASFAAGGVTASYAESVGREEDVVAARARLHDVVVLAHPEAGEEVSTSDSLHAVLFDSGRPIMIAPRNAPAEIGKRVCIGWNGSAESSAAVAAGLPWIERAEAVRILFAQEYHARGPEAQELASYLAWHGVKAEAVQFEAVGGSIGAGLLAKAHEFKADMVVMGAYTRSRLRQLILGGATRHMLEHGDVAVLMNR